MTFIRFYSRLLLQGPVGESQERGRSRISHRRILSLAVCLCLLMSRLYQCLNIILQETRSLFGRIAIRNRGLNYLAVGLAYCKTGPTQYPVLCTRTRARAADISKMVSTRRWASLVDLQLFLEGWDMGEMWAAQKHNLGSCIEQSAASLVPTCTHYTE
jgi:hypothetical protein